MTHCWFNLLFELLVLLYAWSLAVLTWFYTDGFILVFAESDGLPSVIDDDSFLHKQKQQKILVLPILSVLILYNSEIKWICFEYLSNTQQCFVTELIQFCSSQWFSHLLGFWMNQLFVWITSRWFSDSFIRACLVSEWISCLYESRVDDSVTHS